MHLALRHSHTRLLSELISGLRRHERHAKQPIVILFFFSESTMETQDKQRPINGQLISVNHKDTIRLLEVYVKRSLSLNDGSLGTRAAERKGKWVAMPARARRHSSDPSLHLAEGFNDNDIAVCSAFEPPTKQPEPAPEDSEKPTKKPKKVKKPSFWKSVMSFFSRKGNEDKDEEHDSPSDTSEASDPGTTCLPVPTATLQKKPTRRKSLKRRFSKRRLSLIRINKASKDLNPADITGVECKFE